MAARERMAAFCENESPFKGDIEGDESYFGRRQKRDPRDRGAYGKLPVFGLLKRDGKVYAEIVDDKLQSHAAIHNPRKSRS